MQFKHIAALGLAAYGGYQLLIANIPDEQAGALEAISSGSGVGEVLTAEFASGQLVIGGIALAIAYWLGFRL